MEKNIIVDCNLLSIKELETFLDSIDDKDFYCKIEIEFSDLGKKDNLDLINTITKKGYKLFIDLKVKDILYPPLKIAHQLVDTNADMINIHADGGIKLMEEIVSSINLIYKNWENRYETIKNEIGYGLEAEQYYLEKKLKRRPILLGNAVLESINDEDLRNQFGTNKSSMEQAILLANYCKNVGFDGVVCSIQEMLAIKESCGDSFKTVIEGVSVSDSKIDSQELTPICANVMGADYIIVGSEITKAKDCKEAYIRCREDFTQPVTDQTKLDNAKKYIYNLRGNIKSLSYETTKILVELEAFKLDLESPYLLKTGLATPIYCDCKKLYGYPEYQKKIMDYLTQLVIEHYPNCEAIFGTSMSAIPFGALVAERLNLPFGFVRDNEKYRELNREIEGPIESGMKVVQIEDFINYGFSSSYAINILQSCGVEVLGVVSIVDNDYIKNKKLIERKIEYYSLTTMSEIVKYASKTGIIIPTDYEIIMQYANNPKDESWMSEKAEGNVYEKRMIRDIHL